MIYVDADGCPVKSEIFKVAARFGAKVVLVSNSWMRAPKKDSIEQVVVSGDFDAADDWIAGRAGAGDVVVTADIRLASRCLEKGAKVLGPDGRVFSSDTIGRSLADRELMELLRDQGMRTGGPKPLDKRATARFAQRLDEALGSARTGPAEQA